MWECLTWQFWNQWFCIYCFGAYLNRWFSENMFLTISDRTRILVFIVWILQSNDSEAYEIISQKTSIGMKFPAFHNNYKIIQNRKGKEGITKTTSVDSKRMINFLMWIYLLQIYPVTKVKINFTINFIIYKIYATNFN